MPRKPVAIAFSGVRKIRMPQFAIVDGVMDSLKGHTFITGAAYGIDTYTCVEAVRRFPSARHIVVVPWGYALNDVHLAWCVEKDVEVLDLPKPSGKKNPLIARNEYMVELADVLVAFPGGSKEVFRGSGTWTTIRRARTAGIPIKITPLNGEEGWTE